MSKEAPETMATNANRRITRIKQTMMTHGVTQSEVCAELGWIYKPGNGGEEKPDVGRLWNFLRPKKAPRTVTFETLDLIDEAIEKVTGEDIPDLEDFDVEDELLTPNLAQYDSDFPFVIVTNAGMVARCATMADVRERLAIMEYEAVKVWRLSAKEIPVKERVIYTV